MSVNEHTIELINRSLDADLSESEHAELESILTNSEDARVYQEELVSLSAYLESAPDIEPPADLQSRILKRVELPQPKRWFTYTAGWMSGRPVAYGFGAAVGLLAAVAFYELNPSVNSPNDLRDLVGTMTVGDRGGNAAPIAGMEIQEAAVQGTVQLIEKGDILFLEFDIESQGPTELHAQVKETGLVFEGFANRTNDGVGGFLFAKGNFSIASSRKKKFSIIFSASEPEGLIAGSEVQIVISENRGVLYRGSFIL